MAPFPNHWLRNLFSLMCESLLVGVYAVLTGLIIWLLSTGSRPLAHKILFGASIAMFLISVAHLGLVMKQVSVDVLPVAIFQMEIVLATFQFAIGDLVLIWRVWVIWGRNCWIAAGPLAIMIIASALSLHQTSGRSFFPSVVAMIVANTSICTLLIVGRIWYVQYQLRKSVGSFGTPSGRYRGAVFLIIESGALYTAVQISILVLNHIKSPGLSVIRCLDIPLIGILPTLIIILVHFNLATDPNTSSITKNNTLSFQIESQLRDSICSGTLASNRIELDATINNPTFEFQPHSEKKHMDVSDDAV